jgi:hypothetical protein
MKGAHVIDSGREPVALIGEWHDDPTEHRLDDPLIAASSRAWFTSSGR